MLERGCLREFLFLRHGQDGAVWNIVGVPRLPAAGTGALPGRVRPTAVLIMWDDSALGIRRAGGLELLLSQLQQPAVLGTQSGAVLVGRSVLKGAGPRGLCHPENRRSVWTAAAPAVYKKKKKKKEEYNIACYVTRAPCTA